MTDQEEIARRRELGDFVRAQREQLSPAAFGLVGGTSRRRTPGFSISRGVKRRPRQNAENRGLCRRSARILVFSNY